MRYRGPILSDFGECPYLPDRSWHSHLIAVDSASDVEIGHLMQLGFRRLGHHYYNPACPTCKACISLRIPVDRFKPNKNQRQIWRRNQDLEVRVERSCFTEEKYQFYLEYQQSRWDKSEDMTAERFIETYYDQPGTGLEFDYSLNGQRVGLGWVDWSPEGCSSVYFAWKCESRRSLGIYSVMYEIEWAKQNAIPYIYLGLYVEGCESMTYKATFHPHQRRYRDQDWIDWPPLTSPLTAPLTAE